MSAIAESWPAVKRRVVARTFRLSAARIGRMRDWFRENWQRFLDDTLAEIVAV